MKKIAVALLLLLTASTSHPCTTFFIHYNGQMVFGRNYDWLSDAGMVCTNQRGLAKTSLKNNDGSATSWVSQYGSITFNQYGKEFPTGGMNEKGLVVELMWLDGTVYPTRDERPAIGVLQWVQYQLDNCATIEDVITTDKQLRIISNGTPLHYLVADATGAAATIEFLHGKMVVHKGTDLPYPVLANNTYKSSVEAKQANRTQSDNSLQRFSTACDMVTRYKAKPAGKPATDYAFEILDRVAQGDFTKWSIVYDIRNKQIHYKTVRFKDIKTVSLSALDFACSVRSKALNMNEPGAGDISEKMVDFTQALNRQTVEKALEESRSQIRPEKQQKEATIAYPENISCE